MNRDDPTHGDNGRGETSSSGGSRDGVAVLRAAVEAVEAVDSDASKAARFAPYHAFLQDVPGFRAVVASSAVRGSEIEALVSRLGLAIGASVAEKLRGLLRAGRAHQKDSIRSTLRIVSEDDDEANDIRTALDWTEYPGDVTVPSGWTVTREALSRVRIVDRRVLLERVGRPLVVTRRIVDADDGSHSVELAWHDRKGWHTARVPRSLALDTRGLVRLADQGLPVSGSTARDLVDWLTRLDQSEGIPVERGTARMGWVGRSRDAYLLGARCIAAPSVDATHYIPATTGARQLAEAIVPLGTWEGWCAAMASVHDRPGLWLALYASCCAPLLRLLDAPNFGIDFAGKSGTGKTTALAVAVAAYGMPRNGRGYRAWNASIAGAEGTAGVLCDLPIALNEGQLVAPQDRPKAGALLYALIEGAGRTKGALGRLGLASVDDWRTVLVSTSEEGITTWAPTDGVKARIMVIRDPATATAAQSERLMAALRRHHGHLFPRIVAGLVGLPHDQLEEARADYAARLDAYAASARSHVGRRAAQYMAVIDIAEKLIHDRHHVERPSVDVLGWAWARILAEAGEADQALRALETTWTWISACDAAFSRGDATSGQKMPGGGWLGWSLADSRFVGIVPERLYEMLGRAGYGHPDSILAQWRDRGWIVCDKGRLKHRGRTASGRMGERNYMIALLHTSRPGEEDAVSPPQGVDASSEGADLDGAPYPS